MHLIRSIALALIFLSYSQTFAMIKSPAHEAARRPYNEVLALAYKYSQENTWSAVDDFFRDMDGIKLLPPLKENLLKIKYEGTRNLANFWKLIEAEVRTQVLFCVDSSFLYQRYKNNIT